ncbi:MAG: BolA family transcriptional regulator [Hyphomicrobiaceae bacterium]|nr:BolA family transcriptional regulator [Hyphomicrobiaceae bacterium]
MTIQDDIKTKLVVSLQPLHLEVINESGAHSGHRSSPETGESHFRVTVVSEHFYGLSHLQRHRMVNEFLTKDLFNKVHALTLSTYDPSEYYDVKVASKVQTL